MFFRTSSCWNEEIVLLCCLNMSNLQRALCYWRWPLVLAWQSLKALKLWCHCCLSDLCSCQLGIWKLLESWPCLKIRNAFWVMWFTRHLKSIRALRLCAGRPFNSEQHGSLSLENFRGWAVWPQTGKFHSVEANELLAWFLVEVKLL